MKKIEKSKSSISDTFVLWFLLLSAVAVGFTGYYYVRKGGQGAKGVVYRELRA